MITKVKKQQLLTTLLTNRDQHRAIFEEAMIGYREAAIAELEKAILDAKDGKEIFRATRLIQPVDQTNAYNRAIKMIEMNTQEIIDLEEREFYELVLNRWSWGKQFSASNNAYISSPTGKSYLHMMDGDNI